jgi:hypothetical protein
MTNHPNRPSKTFADVIRLRSLLTEAVDWCERERFDTPSWVVRANGVLDELNRREKALAPPRDTGGIFESV